MSDVVRERSGWVSHPASPETVSNAVTAAEMALRAAAGVIGVRVIITLVRDHPLVSLLVASGIGYVVGNDWRTSRRKTSGRAPAKKA